MENSVDEWLKHIFFSASGVKLLEELRAGDLSEEALLSAAGIREEEKELQEKKADMCGYLDRMTDFILETFGEDLELTDWLYGIRSHGDYRRLSWQRPELEGLLDQRGQEARLRKQMEEMEGLYEAADRR